MRSKPVIPREQARHDVEAALDSYAQDAGARTALDFVDMVEQAFRAIAGNPAAGSPRFAHELNLEGLRSRSLKRFPYLVFYVERDDHIDVWRVLHARRDLPASLQDPEPIGP